MVVLKLLSISLVLRACKTICIMYLRFQKTSSNNNLNVLQKKSECLSPSLDRNYANMCNNTVRTKKGKVKGKKKKNKSAET